MSATSSPANSPRATSSDEETVEIVTEETFTTMAEFLETKPDTEVIQKFLETNLAAKTYEELGDLSAYPKPMVIAMLTGFAEEIDVTLATKTKTKTAEEKWEEFKAQPYGDGGAKGLTDIAKAIGKGISYSKKKVIREGLPLGGTGCRKLTLHNPALIKVALDAIDAKRKEIIAEAMEPPKPKKKTTRTKKPDFAWDIVVLNPDDPQGADYDYYLGDADIAEGVFHYKDQSAPKGKDGKPVVVIGKTGKPVKKRRIKAVRKETPFLSTDTCSACTTWDRAGGSKVLKQAGIAGSFVMCCDKKTEGGATYCDAHTKKKPKLGNFWEGKYKTSHRGATATTDSGVSAVGGMSYAKFLVEKCGAGAVGEGVDKDYCVGMGAKW